MLKWVWDRIEGKDVADKSAVGYVPKDGTIDLSGLDKLNMKEIMSVPKDYWLDQLDDLEKYYNDQFGSDLPQGIWEQFHAFKKRLQDSS